MLERITSYILRGIALVLPPLSLFLGNGLVTFMAILISCLIGITCEVVFYDTLKTERCKIFGKCKNIHDEYSEIEDSVWKEV